MNPAEMLRIVDALHREKNIDKETVFDSIETALVSALRKYYGDESQIVVNIDRPTGVTTAARDGVSLTPEEVEDLVGRIGAQTAKQVMIQRLREAERDSLFDEYTAERGQLVRGSVQRYEGGAASVSLNNTEAILPRSEQIPGESHHVNESVRATICDVRKAGSRVKIILSRTRPELVQRLFEQEIPEIAEGVIEIKAIAREPGNRTKVAVSTADPRVDCVGACVGVRGNRIKNIVDELAGERIDIVRWSDDLEELIRNALKPAEVEQVILCAMLGRAIVLVGEGQLSLAIGKRGQNVRLGSKLCGWDIEIMTRDELEESIEHAVEGYSSIEGMEPEVAEQLVGEGFLSYDDLSVIEPEDLMNMGGLTAEQVDKIVLEAEARAEEAEKAAAEERRRRREEEAAQRAAEEAAAADAAENEGADGEGTDGENAGTEDLVAEGAETESTPVGETDAQQVVESAEEPVDSEQSAADPVVDEADNLGETNHGAEVGQAAGNLESGEELPADDTEPASGQNGADPQSAESSAETTNVGELKGTNDEPSPS
ncbi:MAG: transcription termination factor NusA [Pirellulales bacterium]|nr:transcription termination factor NusA [Pirellulales bacterium]